MHTQGQRDDELWFILQQIFLAGSSGEAEPMAEVQAIDTAQAARQQQSTKIDEKNNDYMDKNRFNQSTVATAMTDASKQCQR